MKIYIRQRHRLIAIVAAGLLSVTLIAWNQGPQPGKNDTPLYRDTVPARNPKTSAPRDLDKELEKLDRALEKLEQVKVRNWEEISENIQEQISRIDAEAMKKQAELAMKSVDLNRINLETQKALKAINLEAMQKDINEAMAHVNPDAMVMGKAMSKAKIELERELADLKKFNAVGMDNVMNEMKIELERVKTELNKENIDLNKEMDKARSGIREANEELRGYQEMIYAMEKEGLIDTKKDYKIDYRGGSVYINDKKQTDAVTAKYKKYFKDDVNISKKEGRFNISIRTEKFD